MKRREPPFERDALAHRLAAGLEQMGLLLPAERQERLLDYLALLHKWNRVYNLTAVRDPQEMVGRHLLDSLALLPHLPAGTLLDVGSGAGLPGIPIAIAGPRRPVTLLDGAAKRVRFLTQAVAELGLTDVTALCERAEEHREAYRVVVSRAFAALADFVAVAGRLCAPDGELLAMKGRIDPEELAGVPDGWRVAEVVRLTVPGVAGERHLVRLGRG